MPWSVPLRFRRKRKRLFGRCSWPLCPPPEIPAKFEPSRDRQNGTGRISETFARFTKVSGSSSKMFSSVSCHARSSPACPCPSLTRRPIELLESRFQRFFFLFFPFCFFFLLGDFAFTRVFSALSVSLSLSRRLNVGFR